MYVFAQTSAAIRWGTSALHIHTGDVWPASDPFVLAHPDFFATTPPQGALRYTTPPEVEVEQATAAPGEKRKYVRRG
jgi:hypothetical protein